VTESIADFTQRISTLDIQELESLRRKLAKPKPAELGDVVERELAIRYRLQRDQERFIPTLRRIASLLPDDADINEMSEAEKLAVVLFKPDAPAAKAIAERARRKAAGLPVGGNVPRRRYVPQEGDRAMDRPQTKPTQPRPTCQPQRLTSGRF
jgi:hypothetical protein